ncbi:hypothetical protein CJ030_MR5G023511 [Morella rubra]|uniref:Leucine-rich repeat-containing N-terminal plant-type domain-containing protein n=1 Tax=Morella rubra TaxID=262757 RepID=A0A6A1VKV7_9ROSI|nr:hypothetical protein CJ030_MR5G023511 [Morella rubra]
MPDFKPRDLLFPLVIFTLFYAYQACNQMDRNSLLSLPFKTSSPPLNWSSIDCCQWEGISCDHKGQVKHIWLPSKGLRGSISPFLANLTHLSHLNLSHNSLSGPLPLDIYSATRLQEISLPSNNLSGLISEDIVNLTRLAKLELYRNNIGGKLPQYRDSKLTNITKAIKILMHCKALKVLFLTSNFLQEAMPTDDSIVGSSGFANLRLLSLSDCQLTGQFPFWLSKLKNLEVLFLEANRITGSIPGWLSTLPKLFILSIANNKLHGPIPSGTQLQSFDASDYEGNPGLCGPPLPNQCPHITGNKGDKDIHDEEKDMQSHGFI